MRVLLTFLFVSVVTSSSLADTKTIHVFVALCDNVHQGIVPVPKTLGNGQDPANNLYWGAAYGVKSYFRYKTKDWELVSTLESENPMILERLLFKHATEDAYMLAEAYDGQHIKACIEDFLQASNGQTPVAVEHDSKTLNFGGNSGLVSYIGHDGLMDFSVEVYYRKTTAPRDAIILACYSKSYFSSEMQNAQANPILWTTHLMAPEAYTLKAAIDGWLKEEDGAQIDERAAQAYHKYQQCGIKGARNLFTTGF